MSEVRTVLVTGGAGAIGSAILGDEPRDGWRYVVLDPAARSVGPSREDVVAVEGSILEESDVRRAMDGVTDVVHLAALGQENTWERLVAVNVEGTRTVLEAVRAAGIRRLVYASSHHAVGYALPSDAPVGGLPDDAVPRPDTLYGWSKAAGEALVQLYCERFEVTGTIWRIGHCFPTPRALERLPLWQSPADARRFVHAALTREAPATVEYVWGVSANTRSWFSTAGARRVGYVPRDDSEAYAGLFPGGEADADAHLGGRFIREPLGVPHVAV